MLVVVAIRAATTIIRVCVGKFSWSMWEVAPIDGVSVHVLGEEKTLINDGRMFFIARVAHPVAQNGTWYVLFWRAIAYAIVVVPCDTIHVCSGACFFAFAFRPVLFIFVTEGVPPTVRHIAAWGAWIDLESLRCLCTVVPPPSMDRKQNCRPERRMGTVVLFPFRPAGLVTLSRHLLSPFGVHVKLCHELCHEYCM